MQPSRQKDRVRLIFEVWKNCFPFGATLVVLQKRTKRQPSHRSESSRGFSDAHASGLWTVSLARLQIIYIYIYTHITYIYIYIYKQLPEGTFFAVWQKDIFFCRFAKKAPFATKTAVSQNATLKPV